MAQYTFKASKCDWECLSNALRDRCDVSRRRIPWCRPASLLCDSTGHCDMQCDDIDKPGMTPIQYEGLKTFLQEENILCKKGDVFEINMRCDECDIQDRTMRLKLPKRRRRLPCTDIQEMLEQNQLIFECIYKICDCQKDHDNSLISNCKVTNIGKGQGEISNPNLDGYRNSSNKKTKKTKKDEKNEKSNGSTLPTDGDEEGRQQDRETTTLRISTTSRKKKKGKGQSSRDDEHIEPETTTSRTNKKGDKKVKGKESRESTTSVFSPASRGNENNDEETTRGGKPNTKGYSYNPQCPEYETESIEPPNTTIRKDMGDGDGTTHGEENDEGESTPDPTTDAITNIVKEMESTQSAVPTALTTEGQGDHGSTLTISGIIDTTRGDERITTEVTFNDVTDRGNDTATQSVGVTRDSGEGHTDYVDTENSTNTNSVNVSTVIPERIGNSSTTNTAFVTQQPELVTLPRSGLAFHETTMFNYALAGGVAGLVLISLVILCLILFTRDRKKNKKWLEESMILPPPLDVSDQDESRAVFTRKLSARLSATHDLNDQQQPSTKMKSFSLKKIEPPDKNHI